MKFEILLPVSYVRQDDPSTTRFVQLTEVADLLNQLTAKYRQFGGYTISNPFAPPPLAGGYQGGPQERSFTVMVIAPEHFLNEATEDIQRLVSLFRALYAQTEILCYSHPINRYIPREAEGLRSE